MGVEVMGDGEIERWVEFRWEYWHEGVSRCLISFYCLSVFLFLT